MTIEILLFKLAPGVRDDQFQQAAREATAHLQQFDGFQGRSLFLDEESGQWTDVLRWSSRAETLRTAEQVVPMPELEPFIQQVDPASVQMIHGEEVGVQP